MFETETILCHQGMKGSGSQTPESKRKQPRAGAMLFWAFCLVYVLFYSCCVFQVTLGVTNHKHSSSVFSAISVTEASSDPILQSQQKQALWVLRQRRHSLAMGILTQCLSAQQRPLDSLTHVSFRRLFLAMFLKVRSTRPHYSP